MKRLGFWYGVVVVAVLLAVAGAMIGCDTSTTVPLPTISNEYARIGGEVTTDGESVEFDLTATVLAPADVDHADFKMQTAFTNGAVLIKVWARAKR